MFGSFSIQAGETLLSTNHSRSKKLWLLLAYLICQKGRIVSKKELIQILWNDVPSLANPDNTLKITAHRLRNLLNQLWPGAGHELILYQENGYAWNTSVPAIIDTDQFYNLYSCKCENTDFRIQNLLEILSLYTGNFLEDYSAENWIIPITAHYHTYYIDAVLESLPLLTQKHDYAQIVHICKTALKLEPYHEPLHLHLMQALVELNDKEKALTVYKSLSQNLLHDFGIRPGKEISDYYRHISTAFNTPSLSLQNILEDLEELNPSPSALQCDYEHFLVLCYEKNQSLNYTWHLTHIALISITGMLDSQPLSSQYLKKHMIFLADSISTVLSQDYVFSQCSNSQYVILFPYESYESSEILCRKIIADYTKKHSHSLIQFHFTLQSFSPTSYDIDSI